ncbi:TetR/AcrR family transcriptional regulator [Denitrobaculum tricleocarpae]|uniref:TetR/AcrR family transcriptional regulator n=2 Tax=Denitrobaculum tricleocarpae TaxID=2591009 RepID=A0A545TLE4_9PROT|nr:TetR/AcrR family transcriptional regulator [Denitrobaculum tricleocarpae]
MPRDSKSTRDRILDAANRLFYAEGIRAVSVDAIAEKAGVTKRTLYYHFKSKDELITAYLESRDQPNLKLFAKWFEEAEGGLAAKIEALFRNLAKSARHPRWKGCGFLRTAAELANMPGHPAVQVGAAHKHRFEVWLAEAIAAESADNAAQLARHIVLLMDGAFSTMLIHRDPAYVEAAGDAAAALVRAQTGRR